MMLECKKCKINIVSMPNPPFKEGEVKQERKVCPVCKQEMTISDMYAHVVMMQLKSDFDEIFKS